MGTTRVGQEQIRTLLQNSSGTYMISLPIELVRSLKWKQGQKMTVKMFGEKLGVEKLDKKQTKQVVQLSL